MSKPINAIVGCEPQGASRGFLRGCRSEPAASAVPLTEARP